MDTAVRKINLIPIKQEESPQTGMAIALLRRLSFWALVIFIVSGIAVGGMYYYMQIRYEQLVKTKQELSQIVSQSAAKEGLLASVKQRTALIAKIMGVQPPVGNVFDMLVSFVSPGQITGVSVDEKHTVSLSIHAASIDEVISITDTLIKQTTAHRVRAPQLVSLTFGRTGGFDIGVSFIAVF
ncbi:MAG: hypothetical protein NT149_04905 [Candidatus Gottesmanbacteria bacterium]|nr:hypothetical protein [Candidatus Gottesmanbacteria bacterium]